jgi:hypothetical protein
MNNASDLVRAPAAVDWEMLYELRAEYMKDVQHMKRSMDTILSRITVYDRVPVAIEELRGLIAENNRIVTTTPFHKQIDASVGKVNGDRMGKEVEPTRGHMEGCQLPGTSGFDEDTIQRMEILYGLRNERNSDGKENWTPSYVQPTVGEGTYPESSNDMEASIAGHSRDAEETGGLGLAINEEDERDEEKTTSEGRKYKRKMTTTGVEEHSEGIFTNIVL